MTENKIMVSYMRKSDKKGVRWLFPEEAEILETSLDQILQRNIPVSYSLTAMIRCEISKATLETIDKMFKTFNR